MRRLLLALYPRAWRDRYGDELNDLLDATGLPPGAVLDLVRGALRERGRAATRWITKEQPMRLDAAFRHPTAFGLAALIVVLPTAAIVAVSVLGHELGMSGLAAIADPVIVAVGAWRPFDLALVLAPAISLLLAILPLLEVGMRRADGPAQATVTIQLRWLNLAIAMLALLVGGLVVGHIVTESVLQAGP